MRTSENVDQCIILGGAGIVTALFEQIAREYLLIQLGEPRGREINQHARSVHFLYKLLLEKLKKKCDKSKEN